MKEIHAYLNNDGTYRVEGVGETVYNGKTIDVIIKAARARIDMEVLAEFSQDNTLYTAIIEEEDDNETN